LITVVARTASAGQFCSTSDGLTVIRPIEVYAAGKGWAHDDYFFKCLAELYGDEYSLEAPVRKRVLAACTTAVALPTKQRVWRIDYYCIEMLVNNGTSKVGDRDFVAEMIDEGWLDYKLVAQTGDPRARPYVVAAFTRFRDDWNKQKRHPKNWQTYTELEKREIAVLNALALVGTGDDLELVDSIDREHANVRKWQQLAGTTRDAIRKRAGAK
jgi:hypothetical protein